MSDQADAPVRAWVADGPCECAPEFRVDHTEFGLPLGCSCRCASCGAIWS